MSEFIKPEVAVAAYSIKSLVPRDGTARHSGSPALRRPSIYNLKPRSAAARHPFRNAKIRVRVRANRPLPPLPLLRVLDEPGPTQGSDK